MSVTQPSDLPPYVYQKLANSNALRILDLYPASSADSEVNCELIEIQSDYRDGFEAVSWCWGTGPSDRTLRLRRGGGDYAFHVSSNLESALKALRKRDVVRHLWIDAICINQADLKERNQQVPNMDQIYGSARNVCIWLGDGDNDSRMALEFIKKKVLILWDFDKLCENLKMSKQWAAFINLMKRPWFSRRWVIQEIALANHSTLHCGEDCIDWQEFADAVSLFVEVESATHRLSEVMRLDPNYNHVPDFFGDVPALGAALLVDATSNLFRRSKDGKREPLVSLEYLVSRLSVFETTQPRDIIYALLAVARDTKPQAVNEISAPSDLQQRPMLRRQLSAWGRRNIASTTYRVDYELPIVDVYQDFVFFSIRKAQGPRQLDIICRPWAPEIKKNNEQAGLAESSIDSPMIPKSAGDMDSIGQTEDTITLPSWIPNVSGAAYAMVEHVRVGIRMERRNADPLVGMPGFDQRIYSAAGTRSVNFTRANFKKRASYYSMFVEGFVLDEVRSIYEVARLGNIPDSWLKPGRWSNTSNDPPSELWRTLVADRGPNGRNPPTYYPRACKESVSKGLHPGGVVNTKQLINEGGCTIVAEFLRRVQAVIWNRCLMRTQDDRLGLIHETAREGDKICILYGCSVPVVLRRMIKSDEIAEMECIEDEEIRMQKLVESVRLLKDIYKKKLRRAREAQIFGAKFWTSLWYVKLAWLIGILFYVNYEYCVTWEDTAIIVIGFVLLVPQGIWSALPRSKRRSGFPRMQIWWFLDYIELMRQFLFSILIVYWRKLMLVTLALSLNVFLMFPWQSLPKVWPAVKRRYGEWKNRGNVIKPARTERPRYYWTLIGACYVHGMMDGEAITHQNSKQIKPEKFELR